MSLPVIKYCPGTLAAGYDTYSTTCLRRVFKGRKVSHLLPYNAPNSNEDTDNQYIENQKRISISGVQEKFSVLLKKNKLQLIEDGEQGTYILKPKPHVGKNIDQMPANEHLTMQIAGHVFDIETAANALIFFNDGEQAYITKRFDINDDGSKLATEDFASIAGRTSQTHGVNYKYSGSYLELFELMKKHLTAYRLEAPKLFKLLIFNYIFSNGDAHFKNFSLIETPFGDFRLSPAYDLLNTRLHVNDSDFALEEGLLPKNISSGKVLEQFHSLAVMAELSERQIHDVMDKLLSHQDKVKSLIDASFLSDSAKRMYLQSYQSRHNKLKLR